MCFPFFSGAKLRRGFQEPPLRQPNKKYKSCSVEFPQRIRYNENPREDKPLLFGTV